MMSKISRIGLVGATLAASLATGAYAQGGAPPQPLAALHTALDSLRANNGSSTDAVTALGRELDRLRVPSAPPAPLVAESPADNIGRLQRELEAVRASHIELPSSFDVTSVGMVTAAADAPAAPAAEQKPAEQKPAEQKAAEQKPAEQPAPAADKPAADKPADAPKDTPAAPAKADLPPPPAKRSKDSGKAASLPAVERMKQVSSPAIEGAAAKVEAAPAEAPKAAAKDAMPELPVGDAMNRVISLDFRQMELGNVVALLAQQAGINVIAGKDLTGPVTANLRNVTLRKAMETVLRMNGLGMLQEEGIYRIVPYAEAVAMTRKTATIKLENAKAAEVKKTLDEVLKGAPDETMTAVSVNEATNLLIISGTEAGVAELEKLTRTLDVAKPVTPTVTEAIKINNSLPEDIETLVKSMLTPESGKVAVDKRSRHIVVTDAPVVVEQVRDLLKSIDMPVKQVSIDAMIVDAILDDNSQTGVDWISKAVKNVNPRGVVHGTLNSFGVENDATGVTPGSAGTLTDMLLTNRLTFGVLSSRLDLRAAIAMEVHQQKAKLLANPVVVTVENKKATIDITQEIPYQEYRQSTTGPPMTSTAFKEIGIQLMVTPAVSHDDHIVAEVDAKQSGTSGTLNNIPIEDKRQTNTTLRTKNGQTMFIGGLRRVDDTKTVNKTPVLGDIPVMNFLFRNNVIKNSNTELLVFLTCNVLPDEPGDLSPRLKAVTEEIESVPRVPDSETKLWQGTLHPKASDEDPSWKWRRSE